MARPDEQPMMDRVKVISWPSASLTKTAETEALLATGLLMDAPWMRSDNLLTLRD